MHVNGIQAPVILLIITLPIQQMQWPSVMLISVLALAQSILMMLAVQAVRPTSLTALETLQSTIDVPTPRMLE